MLSGGSRPWPSSQANPHDQGILLLCFDREPYTENLRRHRLLFRAHWENRPTRADCLFVQSSATLSTLPMEQAGRPNRSGGVRPQRAPFVRGERKLHNSLTWQNSTAHALPSFLYEPRVVFDFVLCSRNWSL
jgi:hypothetical protein